MTVYDAWGYESDIEVTGETGAGTLYQIHLTVDSNGGSADIDLEGKGEIANFGDLRFASDDRAAELDYWIEDPTADPCDVWVRVSSDLGSNQTIVCCIGKTGVSDASSGDDTFLFFDGFTGTNGDPVDSAKWEDRSTPTIQSNQAECINDEFIVQKTAIDIRGKAVRWRTRFSTGDRQFWMVGDIKTIATADPYVESGQDGYVLDRYDNMGQVRHIIDGSLTDDWEDTTYFTGYAATNWHEMEIATDPTGSYSTKFKIKKASWETVHTEDWIHASYDMFLYAGIRRTVDATTTLHARILERKYQATEPAFSSAGAWGSISGEGTDLTTGVCV